MVPFWNKMIKGVLQKGKQIPRRSNKHIKIQPKVILHVTNY